MTSAHLILHLHSPNPPEHLHEFRNLAEDIHRVLRENNLGSVPNMDSATTQLRLEISHPKFTKTALRLVEKILQHRNHTRIAPFCKIETLNLPQ